MTINPKYEESIKQTIVMMYQGGISVNSIVQEIEGVTPRDVRTVLKEQGILSGPGRKPSVVESYDEATINAMLVDYYDKIPMRELLEKYHIRSMDRFYVILRELGQPARQNTPEHQDGKRLRLDHACELYKEGVPIWKIVEETGVDQPRLHAELHRRKIPTRRGGAYQ
jgi:transposase-like protein